MSHQHCYGKFYHVANGSEMSHEPGLEMLLRFLGLTKTLGSSYSYQYIHSNSYGNRICCYRACLISYKFYDEIWMEQYD